MKGQLVPVATPQIQSRARALQCGLCHQAGATYGLRYRLFAGPDMVFYNAWLHVCGEPEGAVARRGCVIAPSLRQLPCAGETPASALAVQVGVWLGWAKLRDDAQDEGGWTRRLAARAFAPGSERARQELSSRGFPVREIEGWMSEQARIERMPSCEIEAAAAPTVAIAALLFGFGGGPDRALDRPLATAIGAEIGRYLFYLDNLDDYERDLAGGQYNALARAFGASPLLPAPARAAALAGARASVERIEQLLAPISDGPWASHVRATVVARFRLRLRHLDFPTAHAIAPAPPRWRRIASTLGSEIARRAAFQAVRLQIGVLMWVGTVFPRIARGASPWWPSSATPAALGLDGIPPDGQLPIPGGGFAADGSVDGGCCDDGLCDSEACCEDMCSDASCAPSTG